MLWPLRLCWQVCGVFSFLPELLRVYCHILWWPVRYGWYLLRKLWIWIDWIRIRIQIRIKGFDDQKSKKKIPYSWNFFFRFLKKKKLQKKTSIKPKGRPSYRRTLLPSKENIQHQKMKFINCFLFFWTICPLGSGLRFGYGSRDPIESGSNPDPDPLHCLLHLLSKHSEFGTWAAVSVVPDPFSILKCFGSIQWFHCGSGSSQCDQTKN